MPQLQEGEVIKVGDRTGIITFVNKQLKLYQVNYSKRRAKLLPFDQVKGSAEDETTNRLGRSETVIMQADR